MVRYVTWVSYISSSDSRPSGSRAVVVSEYVRTLVGPLSMQNLRQGEERERECCEKKSNSASVACGESDMKGVQNEIQSRVNKYLNITMNSHIPS